MKSIFKLILEFIINSLIIFGIIWLIYNFLLGKTLINEKNMAILISAICSFVILLFNKSNYYYYLSLIPLIILFIIITIITVYSFINIIYDVINKKNYDQIEGLGMIFEFIICVAYPFELGIFMCLGLAKKKLFDCKVKKYKVIKN